MEHEISLLTKEKCTWNSSLATHWLDPKDIDSSGFFPDYIWQQINPYSMGLLELATYQAGENLLLPLLSGHI